MFSKVFYQFSNNGFPPIQAGDVTQAAGDVTQAAGDGNLMKHYETLKQSRPGTHVCVSCVCLSVCRCVCLCVCVSSCACARLCVFAVVYLCICVCIVVRERRC